MKGLVLLEDDFISQNDHLSFYFRFLFRMVIEIENERKMLEFQHF